MLKLYALEDDSNDTENSNELLIDKILKKAELDKKSPMSLTADVLKQRQELKKEIGDKLEQDPEETQDEENSTDDVSSSDDQPSDEQQDSKPDDATDGETKEEDASDTSEKESSNNSDDDTDAADDKESLNSLVGSGLKEGSDKKEEKKESKEKEEKEEPATESFSYKPTLNTLFKPLRDHYNKYKVSLETFNLQSQAISLEEQPIVYVKESVLESLSNLVKLSQAYIDNNTKFTESIADSVKDTNERITIFKGFVENQKYHFTNKLINDRGILSTLGIPGKSDPRETIRILLNYIERSSKATSLMVTNEFTKLDSSYLTSEFTKEDNEFHYKEILPGFNMIRISLGEYKNYLNTKIQEFQYYKLKVQKTEDLFNLDAIGVSEDKELLFITGALDKLLVNVTTSVDNLNDVSTHFSTFINEVKVIIYDIQQDKHKDLASIDIDSKVKDFIKFKLAIETYYININLMLDYMTSLMSVLNQCVELKD